MRLFHHAIKEGMSVEGESSDRIQRFCWAWQADVYLKTSHIPNWAYIWWGLYIAALSYCKINYFRKSAEYYKVNAREGIEGKKRTWLCRNIRKLGMLFSYQSLPNWMKFTASYTAGASACFLSSAVNLILRCPNGYILKSREHCSSVKRQA